MDFAIVAKHGITFGNPKRNSTILIPVGQFKTRSLVFYPQGMRREKYQAVHLLRWPDRQFGADRPRLLRVKRFGICHSRRSTSFVSG